MLSLVGPSRLGRTAGDTRRRGEADGRGVTVSRLAPRFSAVCVIGVLATVAMLACAPAALADSPGQYSFGFQQVPGSSGVTFNIDACPSVVNSDGSSGPQCPTSGYLTLTRGGAVVATSPTYGDLVPNSPMQLALPPGGLQAGDRVDAYLNGVDSGSATFSGAPSINFTCGGYTITGKYDPGATLTVERLSNVAGSQSSPQTLSASGGNYTATFSDPVTAAQEFEDYTTGGGLRVSVYTGAECSDASSSGSANGGGATGISTSLKPSMLRAKITKATISKAHHTATFAFKSLTAAQYQCALVEQPAKKTKRGKKAAKPDFTRCKSPAAYRQLKKGKYTFEVRAAAGSVIGSAAKRAFTI